MFFMPMILCMIHQFYWKAKLDSGHSWILGSRQLAQTSIDHCNKTSTGNSHIVTLAYFVFCYTRMTQMLFYSLFQANEAFKFVMERKSTGKVLIKTR